MSLHDLIAHFFPVAIPRVKNPCELARYLSANDERKNETDIQVKDKEYGL